MLTTEEMVEQARVNLERKAAHRKRENRIMVSVVVLFSTLFLGTCNGCLYGSQKHSCEAYGQALKLDANYAFITGCTVTDANGASISLNKLVGTRSMRESLHGKGK